MKNLKNQLLKLLKVLVIGSTITVSAQDKNELLVLEVNEYTNNLFVDMEPSYEMRQLEALNSDEHTMKPFSNSEMLGVLFSKPLKVMKSDEYLMKKLDVTSVKASIIYEIGKLKNKDDLQLELRSDKGKLIKEKNYKSGDDIFSDVLNQKQGEYVLVLKVEDEVFKTFKCVVSRAAKF